MKYEEKLKPCPICGRKSYVRHSIVDGFDFGFDVGCPAFCLDDGIHGIDENSPQEEHPSLHCRTSKQQAVSEWNEWVDNYIAKRKEEAKN